MLHTRKAAMLAVFGVAVAASLLTGALSASATTPTTYYVNSASGSDSAAGTSTATAWRSLSKVDATTFSPGDQILFDRGQTWSGQLHPLGSGSAAAQITIGAYGTGAAPVIDGGSLASGASVYLLNQQYWTIHDLTIVNDSGANNFGTLAAAGSSRDGILVVDNGAGTLHGITIADNDVHDVNGCFNCSDVDSHVNGAIVVYAAGASDSFAGVTVQGNSIDGVGRTGITFWDESYYTSSPYTMVQSQLSTGVTIQDNSVTNVDGDGILDFGTEGAMLQHNVVGNSAQRTIVGSTESSSAGLWPTRAMDTTVQYNEVYGTLTQGTDGQGFDVDLASVNTKVQYNYSHDNEGGFLLMMGGYSSNLVVRDNLSVNDSYGGDKGIFTFSYGVPEQTAIYNNTVYIPSGTTENPIFCDGCDGTTPGTWSFRNNIVENLGSGTYLYPNHAGAVIDHNVFYGNHPASEPSDAAKLTSNPLLVSPGASPLGIGSVGGYEISGLSPAAGSGAVIGGNGGSDYFGNVVSATAAPSRGFHEVQTFGAATSLTDDLNDWLLSSSHSSNMILDTSTPFSNMNGDGSRVSRSTASAGSVTWELDGMQTFSASVYEFYATLSTLTFSSSPDGTSWTAVAVSNTTPVTTTNGWAATTFTPSAALPSGTKFLKATISTPTAWALEIGQMVISE